MNIISHIIRFLALEKSFRIECSFEKLKKLLFVKKKASFTRIEVKKEYLEYDYSCDGIGPTLGQPGSRFTCEKSSEENGTVEIKYYTKKTSLISLFIPLLFIILFNLNTNASVYFRIVSSSGVLLVFWSLQSFSLRHISGLQLNGLKRDLNLLLENSEINAKPVDGSAAIE